MNKRLLIIAFAVLIIVSFVLICAHNYYQEQRMYADFRYFSKINQAFSNGYNGHFVLPTIPPPSPTKSFSLDLSTYPAELKEVENGNYIVIFKPFSNSKNTYGQRLFIDISEVPNNFSLDDKIKSYCTYPALNIDQQTECKAEITRSIQALPNNQYKGVVFQYTMFGYEYRVGLLTMEQKIYVFTIMTDEPKKLSFEEISAFDNLVKTIKFN